VSHKDIDREKHSGNRQFNWNEKTPHSEKKTYLLSKTLSMLPKIKEQELLDEQEPNISS